MQDHLVGSSLANTAAALGVTFIALTDVATNAIVGGVVSIVLGTITTYFAYKAKTLSAEARDISAETHKAVNGKMEEFKRMAEDFYHAKGVSDEKIAAEGKAGIEAIAAAKGKAEGKAEGILTILPPPIKPPSE